MIKNKNWGQKAQNTITPIKEKLAGLSIRTRSKQYSFFLKVIKPNKKTLVLDVGPTSKEILKDSNLFDKLYPYPKNLTLATIEDRNKLKKLYPDSQVKKITPHKKFPFKNRQFDIVVSWATLEHVGNYSDQEFFLNELLRVGKKIFVTTPYRACPYEPHSGVWFIHWLPLKIFRRFCCLIGKNFWGQESNLNPLYIRDLKKMKLIKKVSIKIYRMFNLLPSHIIIFTPRENK